MQLQVSQNEIGHMFDRHVLYTKSEVADRLKICQRTLFSLMSRGKLPHLRVGRQVRIAGADLITFLELSYERN